MSDRTAHTVIVYRCDPAEAPELRRFLDDCSYDDNPKLPDGEVVGATWVDGESSVGSTEDRVYEMIDLAPLAAFKAWEDPAYEWLGTVALHVPELGTFAAPCDSEGNVVLTYRELAGSKLGGSLCFEELEEAFGLRWLAALSPKS